MVYFQILTELVQFKRRLNLKAGYIDKLMVHSRYDLKKYTVLQRSIIIF